MSIPEWPAPPEYVEKFTNPGFFKVSGLFGALVMGAASPPIGGALLAAALVYGVYRKITDESPSPQEREYMKWYDELSKRSVLDVRDHVDLVFVREKFRNGSVPPLSEIHVHGDIGQAIAHTYAEMLKLRGAQRKGYWQTATGCSGGHEAPKGYSAWPIFTFSTKIVGNCKRMDKMTEAVMCMPLAVFVQEFLKFGVILKPTGRSQVVLKWGEEEDYSDLYTQKKKSAIRLGRL